MSRVPTIRFKGFTDPWEQRKLGDLATKTFGGGTPSTEVDAYWDGHIPWIQSSNLSENSFLAEIEKFISDSAIANSAAQIIPANSIAVVTHVGVGKLAIMPEEYATSQDFISLSCLKGDINYCVYAIQKRLQEDLSIVQGSAIKGITKDDLLNKRLTIPSQREQRQIGSFFAQLDNLITLHQRKLKFVKYR